MLTCVKQYAAEALAQSQRLLIIYDSLKKMFDDTSVLMSIFAELGIKPEECYMINGQDRKSDGRAMDGSGCEAGLRPEEKHRVIISTSCVEAGVNIENLCHAIIDPGQDAAALLQRIGRVARGNVDGKVWIAKPERCPAHLLKLQKLSGVVNIENLRHALQPLRELPLEHARRLGSAYWSMLGRKTKLVEHLYKAHDSISDAKPPGGFLNGLHAAVESTMKKNQAHYKKWLDAIDKELMDLRGFSPTVSVQFADYPKFEYSRDWAMANLEQPYEIDGEGVWLYRKPRGDHLLEKSRKITISLLCPNSSPFNNEMSFGLVRRDLISAYIAKWKIVGLPDEEFLRKAADFIQATGILVRQKINDDPII